MNFELSCAGLWIPFPRESLRNSWRCFSKQNDSLPLLKESAGSNHHMIRAALFVECRSIESTRRLDGIHRPREPRGAPCLAEGSLARLLMPAPECLEPSLSLAPAMKSKVKSEAMSE